MDAGNPPSASAASDPGKVDKNQNVRDSKKPEVLPSTATLGQNSLTWAQQEVDMSKKNQKPFVIAKGNVQRVIDVTLLVTNMAQLARIVQNENVYTKGQFAALVTLLCISMVLQVIAGVCFFIMIQWKERLKDDPEAQLKHWWDYVSISCVAAIMIINIFVSSFQLVWTEPTNTYPGQNYLTLANGTRAVVIPGPNGTFSFVPKF